ncbi:MAG: hypothetical protein A2W03_15465 [Candidatus Aminicenantes bacterium RBG_16_63_16]|nr:MAG: hypothetical protein A2W03_15465 [Candidatus Aminicenantes bacterium RBG_16_63_16]
MFRALYFKEWREKAFLFFFELGILVLLLGQFVFREKTDIREWLVYAVLLLFFPFAALILGAAGFEAEYRQGAWAYLFSRPVRKPMIWLAKYSALLSMLAALWLVFLAAWLALPEFRGLVGDPRLLLGFRIEPGFPFWSLWQSVFLLTVAFSLSLLHEKQFNILFLSLLAGLGLTAAAWVALMSKAGWRLAWITPSKALPAFLISQTLMALAFAAASILTLVRSDFSQSRKQMLGFIRWLAPFLVLAVAGTGAWVRWTPVQGDRFLWFVTTTGGEPHYMTERGVFKYSAQASRIQWLTKATHLNIYRASASGGKIAFTAFDIKDRNDIVEELWVEDANGGRRRIIGRGPRENEWPQEAPPIADLLLSPDGTRLAILSANAYGKQRPRRRPPLWIVNTDGTGLENLPDDPALFEDLSDRYYFHLVAWAREGNAVLLSKRSLRRPWTFSLWLYDLGDRTARIVLDNAVIASWLSPVSPRGDRLAIKYQRPFDAPWGLALLDLKTMETTDIAAMTGEVGQALFQISWDPKGDRLAYVVRRALSGGQNVFVLAVYSLLDNRTVAEKMMTRSESSALLFQPSWASEGAKLLVLDREANGLKIFDEGLREIDQVAFPRWLDIPGGLYAVGDQVLIEDEKADSLWRVDLETRRWKKLY